MGLIKSWIREMGNTWSGMAQGDPRSFMGTGTGHGGGTGTGHGGGTGTGHTTTPDGTVLGAPQRQKLMHFFHQNYGRYPISEFEFQQWLHDNW